MTLTDKKIQSLQDVVKDYASYKEGEIFEIPETNEYYQVVNSIDETTQALAVVPVDNSKGHNPDYSQTAIVVAGTQPGLTESTKNVIEARSGMTPQVDDISDFYDSTAAKLEKDYGGGTISNMSGFSQSGPAVAKVAAAHQVPKITNFMDWAASSALYSKTNPKGITAEEKAWLDQHATIYMDSTRDVTYLDGKNHGDIPYGKKYIVEGTGDPISDHDTAFPRIKGNGLDIDWYVKHGQFASGMTKEQVIKVAKMKAKNAKGWDLKDPSTWSDSTDYRDYVKEYKEKYGSFALADPKALDFAAVQNRLTSLRSQLQSASGSQKILLRQELVTAAAQSAQAKAESFNFRVKSRISQSKETIDSQLKTFERDIRSLSQHLSEGEVSELLSELGMEKVWDEGNEAAALAEGDRTQEELTDFTQKLMAGAEDLTAADQAGAELFR